MIMLKNILWAGNRTDFAQKYLFCGQVTPMIMLKNILWAGNRTDFVQKYLFCGQVTPMTLFKQVYFIFPPFHPKPQPPLTQLSINPK